MYKQSRKLLLTSGIALAMAATSGAAAATTAPQDITEARQIVVQADYVPPANRSYGEVIARPPADANLSATVRYSDLDLSNPAGAKVLYQRIKQAARTVCAPLESKQFAFHALWRDCYEQAVVDAVTGVDRPKLTALHRTAVRTARS